jgi:hypothetical protein
MTEAERLIRGLVEMIDCVVHTGEIPRGADLLLEDVRIYLRDQRYPRRRYRPFTVIKGGR